MSEYLPPTYLSIRERHPQVHEHFVALAAACHDDGGALGPKSRHLVKLGIAIGARSEGSVRSHVRQALEAGAPREEIEHVALLAVTTTGFPNAVAALSWIDEVLEAREGD